MISGAQQSEMPRCREGELLRRIAIVIQRIETTTLANGDIVGGKYQAQLRQAAGGNLIFFSRRQGKASAAKRDAELLFGPLEWIQAPSELRASEPMVLQIAYINV